MKFRKAFRLVEYFAVLIVGVVFFCLWKIKEVLKKIFKPASRIALAIIVAGIMAGISIGMVWIVNSVFRPVHYAGRNIIFWISVGIILITLIVILGGPILRLLKKIKIGVPSINIKTDWGGWRISVVWILLFLLVAQFYPDGLKWLWANKLMLLFSLIFIAATIVAGGKKSDKKKGGEVMIATLIIIIILSIPACIFLFITNVMPRIIVALDNNKESVTYTSPKPAIVVEEFKIVAPPDGWVTVRLQRGEKIVWRAIYEENIFIDVDGTLYLVKKGEVLPKVYGYNYRFSSAVPGKSVEILVTILK